MATLGEPLNDSLSAESGAESGLSVEEPVQRLSVKDMDGEAATSASTSSTEELAKESLRGTVECLRAQLEAQTAALADKEAEVARIQRTTDCEIHDLTETLFKEAYKLADEANAKRRRAERARDEADGKVELLQAEIDALKIIVQQSAASPARGPRRGSFASPFTTPSRSTPRRSVTDGLASGAKAKLFALVPPSFRPDDAAASQSGDEEAVEDLVCPNCGQPPPVKLGSEEAVERAGRVSQRGGHVDPALHALFLRWREKGLGLGGGEDNGFLAHLVAEDLGPCLSFPSQAMVSKEELMGAVLEERLTLELVPEEGGRKQARDCALLGTARFCPFRLRIGEEGPWLRVSEVVRERILAACELLVYLRHVSTGLVSVGVHEAYWEVQRLRKDVALARLGLAQPHK